MTSSSGSGRSIAAAALVIVLSGAAAAQPTVSDPARATRIEQIPASATPPAARDEALPAPDVRPPAQVGGQDRGGRPAQITGRDASAAPVAQLNRERRSARGEPQVYRGKRSAQAADPLSSRTQSKPSAVVRLGGKDRCDPDVAKPGADCARVIETRSAEFTRPNPLTLSPEQRLLVDERLRALPTNAESAVRRIGRNEVDSDAPDAQSVASLVLAPKPAAAKPVEKDAASGLDAEVLSVINALAGGAATTTPPPPQ